MSRTQKEVFAGGEGDAWFLRNRVALEDRARLQRDPVLHVMEANALAPSRVLEVGASNGFRLHEIHARGASAVSAVEPSASAIEDGRARFPEIDFHQGSAERLPFADGAFDCVIANAVLHWLDRACLLPALAEIDRVLADGGVFILGDFAPARPQKVRYHHRPDESVFTYKTRYHDILVATGNYRVMAWQIFDHDTMKPSLDASGDDAYGVCLLRKELGAAYAPKEL